MTLRYVEPTLYRTAQDRLCWRNGLLIEETMIPGPFLRRDEVSGKLLGCVHKVGCRVSILLSASST